ncbi:hypothetical protein [Tenacibaculum sp. nBUS_03]|uniref:hypothetical protein n=1 Tax=Tenacibaculum sp. nBUS_03 TaxID=3395320 RepID=UPI003EBC7527
MNVLSKVYKFVVNVGIYRSIEEGHIKIRLLTAFCLIWVICVFMILALFFSQGIDRSIVLHLFSFLTIISVYGIHKYKIYILVRVLFIETLTMVVKIPYTN